MDHSSLRAYHLRCEYLREPSGIDEPWPRLNWLVTSNARDTRQEAFRILVAGSEEQLESDSADLWDSGWVDDARCNQVPYAGSPLHSRQNAYWKVMVRDNHGNEAVSRVAKWTMGLLDRTDWKAGWIALNPEAISRDGEAVQSTESDCGSAAYFRREFPCEKPVRSATLYASARGLFYFQINGMAVSEDCFAPEWTDYRVRIHYRTYEVTRLLQEGANAICAVLGDGWFSGFVGWQESRGRYGLDNSLLAQLEIEFTDGSREIITTDKSWKCDTGPILSSDMMMGETFDARREQAGWNGADFDDQAWLAAREVPAPEARLVAQRSEPVRITGELSPVSITEIEPGVHLFDLGQNIAGWVRIRVNEEPGTRLSIRHGERLSPDGALYTENLRRARATDVYVCRGDGAVEWQPRFTFHGFQYVEIRGLSRKPDTRAVTGCVIHSGTPPAGSFTCSHQGVNRLWLNGWWSQKDNFLSVPTDCPQRDERLGWMGDAQIFIRTAMYNMDVAAFFTKWMTDVTDAQTAEGIFPDTAPHLPEDEGNYVGLDGLGGGPAWADAGVIIPWTMWKIYGDTRIVERHWESMTAWMDYLERANPEWLRVNELGNNYGDWLCIPSDTSFRTQSPMKDLLATAFWADDAAKLAELAEVLGKAEEAERFRKAFSNVRNAFQRTFVNDDGTLTVKTQTAYLLALAMELLPAELREAAAAHLVSDIEKLGWHLSTGFVGIRFLNSVLTDCGYPDVAYRLLFQDDHPSWLYPVKHGATTIWERWNGWTEEEGFFNPHMNSFNHYSLGSVGEWLFSHVAGIQPSLTGSGFADFVLKPWPTRKLAFARADYQSIQGLIHSEWRWQAARLDWEFSIPANTLARVHVPSNEGTPIHESGQSIESDASIRPVCRAGPFAIYEFPSGSYRVSSTFTG